MNLFDLRRLLGANESIEVQEEDWYVLRKELKAILDQKGEMVLVLSSVKRKHFVCYGRPIFIKEEFEE